MHRKLIQRSKNVLEKQNDQRKTHKIQKHIFAMCVGTLYILIVCVCEQRLSSDCEDQIRVILQESALDYRLDPQLQMHCSEEVSPHILLKMY